MSLARIDGLLAFPLPTKAQTFGLRLPVLPLTAREERLLFTSGERRGRCMRRGRDIMAVTFGSSI
jgi:hypothetical protein